MAELSFRIDTVLTGKSAHAVDITKANMRANGFPQASRIDALNFLIFHGAQQVNIVNDVLMAEVKYNESHTVAVAPKSHHKKHVTLQPEVEPQVVLQAAEDETTEDVGDDPALDDDEDAEDNSPVSPSALQNELALAEMEARKVTGGHLPDGTSLPPADDYEDSMEQMD
jgi:cell envelope opacity-associated protein A